MNIHRPIDLKSRLLAATRAWCAAHDAPLSRLGKRVAGDAAFFDRITPVEPLACNVATLEKFARFLADPANWPEPEPGAEHQERVPAAALQFCHAVGVSAAGGQPATVKPGEMSGNAQRVA